MEKKNRKAAGQGFGPFVLSAEEKEKLDIAMSMVEYAQRSPYPQTAVLNSFKRVLNGELAEFKNDAQAMTAAFDKILKGETAKLNATA